MKNKLIYIILLVFLLSVMSVSSTFCLEIDVLPEWMQEFWSPSKVGSTMYEGISKSFSEANYYIIFQDTYNNTTLIYSALPISVRLHYYDDTDTSKYFINSPTEGQEIIVISFTFSDDEYKWGSSGIMNSVRPESFDGSIYAISQSNFDVIDTETGDLLFQDPPQVTLAPIVEGVETEKTLEEIILILPLILVIVVSFLGLRKALRMLSMLLRRS